MEKIEAQDAQIHQIDFNNRYVMVLEFPAQTDMDIMNDAIQHAAQMLDEWKESGRSILVLGLTNGLKLRLERVDEPED